MLNIANNQRNVNKITATPATIDANKKTKQCIDNDAEERQLSGTLMGRPYVSTAIMELVNGDASES